ncbi:MAG: hypothetical protein IPG91_07265 [Ideonella sp.]|nr:hypothetical protein [Ideonella sp.]
MSMMANGGCAVEIQREARATAGDALCGEELAAAPAPLKAAGELFGEIASDVCAAVLVAQEAIAMDEPANLLVALVALLERVGALADRAASICGAVRA